MNADRLDTFISGYAPTWCYMQGLQGNWGTSDFYRRGGSMYRRLLGEKELQYEEDWIGQYTRT